MTSQAKTLRAFAVIFILLTASIIRGQSITSQSPVPYTSPFTLYAGANPAFSVTATGTPISFQWFTNGVAAGGATNTNFTLTNVQAAFSAYCVVSFPGNSVTSYVWSASVIMDPTNNSGSVATYPQAVMALQPIGYWRVNESDNGSGDQGVICHDYTGGNNGIYTNLSLGNQGYSPTADPSDTSGWFGHFSTPSDVNSIAAPDFSTLSGSNAEFTVEAWVNPTAQETSVGAGISAKGYFNQEEYALDCGAPANSFRFCVRDAAGLLCAVNSTVSTANSSVWNHWYHLVGVCDEANGQVWFYINGQAAGNTGIPVGSGITNSSATPMSIGSRAGSATSGNNQQFYGYINDVAVFNYAFTANQVFNEYLNAGNLAPSFVQPPPTTETVSAGTTVVVPVTAAGTGPLNYKWVDQNAGTNIFIGTTNGLLLNATLVVSNVPASWNGNRLSLTVTNAWGSTNVQVALTVATAPLIVSNLPPQVTLAQGQPYTYTVGVLGLPPLSYQWYSNSIPVLGQTNPAFSFFAGNPGSLTYDVVITNLYGSATSTVSTVTILPVTPMTLQINNSPGYVISNDFSGLGFEISQQLPNVNGVSGNLFSPQNTQVMTLFQNMKIRVMRVGGGSAEWTTGAHLADSDIDNLFGFAQAAGVKVIYALQLENGTTSYDDATALYIWQNYRPLLDWFAIGNEPDLSDYWYPPYGTGTDPAIYDFFSYMADWDKFEDSVSNTIASPGFSISGCDANIWASLIVSNQQSSGRLGFYTQHYYFGGNGANFTADQLVSNMLSAAWDTNIYPTDLSTYVVPVVSRGFHDRFTEVNDVVGGTTNASDSFAAALWALDCMHWWALQGCTGFNFHNNEWLTTDTIFLDGNKNFQVHPKAYGIKAWDVGGHGSVEPVTINNPSGLNLTAYAVADPTNLYVTLINKEYRPGARNATVTMQLSGFQPGSVAAMYLTSIYGTNVEATNGVTLGGGVITNNAPWQGQWTPLGVTTNGQFALTVPAASAAIVKMAVLPGVPAIVRPSGGPTNYASLYAGTNAALSVSAIGASPLNYRWLRDGVPVAGATSASYSPSVSTPGNVNSYVCIVTNYLGSITSLVWSVTTVSPPIASYARAALALQPVGYWPLNETPNNGTGNQGVVCHDYVAGNNGVYSNTVLAQAGYNPITDPADTSALFGTYASPNSAVGQIQNLDFSVPTGGNGEFSVVAWVNGTNAAQPLNAGIVAKGYFYQEELDLDEGVSPSSDFRFEVRNAAGTSYNANGTINATNLNATTGSGWHFLAGVCDEAGGNIFLYVDGVLNSQAAIPVSSGITNSAADPISIGARPSSATSGNNQQFIGRIDDVAIYNYALSASQVHQLFTAASVPVMNLAPSGNNFALTYTGTLLSSTNVDGPYQPVSGASPPTYLIPLTNSQMFYRVSNP